MKTAFRVLGLLLALFVYTVVLIHFMHQSSLKVLAQWKKPSTVQYAPDTSYYLSVVEGEPDWRSFPFALRRRTFIYVGRDPGEPSYGHMIDFTFYTGPDHYDDVAGFLRTASVTWSLDGAELALPSGHRLFVPKDMFINGR